MPSIPSNTPFFPLPSSLFSLPYSLFTFPSLRSRASSTNGGPHSGKAQLTVQVDTGFYRYNNLRTKRDALGAPLLALGFALKKGEENAKKI